MSDVDVAVIGAGIAGLTAATRLKTGGAALQVFEASTRAGGPVSTARTKDYLYERGPSTVRATPELLDIARKLGIEVQYAESLRPYVVRRGQLLPIPPRLRDLLSGRLMPRRALLEVLAEPFRRGPSRPSTVKEFVAARFGKTAANELADLMTLGIYGTTADRIGFEAAFPALAELLQEHGSLTRGLWAKRREGGAVRAGILSTPKGLQALTDRLAEELGSDLHFDHRLRTIVPDQDGYQLGFENGTSFSARNLIFTGRPASLAEAINRPSLSRLVLHASPTPQCIAVFAVRDPAATERWQSFGFLAPSNERLPIMGCLFPSQIFSGRAPVGTLLMTCFLAERLHNADSAQVDKEVVPILQGLLQTREPFETLEIIRYPEGIPTYDRRHTDRVRLLRNALSDLPGFHLAGAAYDGVSFGAAAASGAAAAEMALQRL